MALGLVACRKTEQQQTTPNELRIPSSSIAIGASGDKADEQVLSFRISLYNPGQEEVYVGWVEPVLSSEVAKRLITQERQVVVDKALAPGQTLEVTGEFRFMTQGEGKSQINSWGPFISGVRVSTEQVIPLNQ
jgi:acyl-ACP thioesterase